MTNNNNHLITPPLELVQKWVDDAIGPDYEQRIATQAARWGADQELEACIDAILSHPGFELPELFVELLRTARRPKPPSLKEQALEALKHAEEGWRPIPEDCALIRRALESLPD